MKTLSYVLRSLLALLLIAGATSCAVSLFPDKKQDATAAPVPSPKEARRAFEFLLKYPDFIRQHPELFPRDTVKIKVPYEVPAAAGLVKYVPVHDTVFIEREHSYIDTVLVEVERATTVAQRAAAEAKLHKFLDNRPVLRDTLRADTLGVHIKLWLSGRTYKVLIRRDAIQGEAAGQLVTGGLAPCPPLPAPVHYPFYNPRRWGWPWYVWFGLGILAGAAILWGLVQLLYRLQTRRSD
jgi:hypothetical protein